MRCPNLLKWCWQAVVCYRGFRQVAMLEDKQFKFAIWLCRLTWISRAVTFDYTEWPGYPGQSHLIVQTDLAIQGSHIWLHRLTWISRAVTFDCTDWPGYPGQSHLIAQIDLDIQGSHIWLHRLTWISRGSHIWLHRLTWLSSAVTFYCTDWPGYPGHKQPYWRTKNLSLLFDCADWPGYPGQSGAPCMHAIIIRLNHEWRSSWGYSHGW